MRSALKCSAACRVRTTESIADPDLTWYTTGLWLSPGVLKLAKCGQEGRGQIRSLESQNEQVRDWLHSTRYRRACGAQHADIQYRHMASIPTILCGRMSSGISTIRGVCPRQNLA